MYKAKAYSCLVLAFWVLGASAQGDTSRDSSVIVDLKDKLKRGEVVFGMVAEAKDAHCIMRKAAAAISRELGKKITLEALPAKRLPQYVKKGWVHGDFSRTSIYETMVPEALKVETPLVVLPFYAYGYGPENKTVTDWDSLKKYKLVQTRGYSFVKKYLSQHNVHILGSEYAAFGFIKAKRADLIVADEVTAEFILDKYAPEFDGLQKIGNSVDSLSMNTYIAPQYPELLDEYNTAVKKFTLLKDHNKIISKEGCE